MAIDFNHDENQRMEMKFTSVKRTKQPYTHSNPSSQFIIRDFQYHNLYP